MDELPRIEWERERESAEFVDVEIVDSGYTDEILSDGSGTTTPDDPVDSLSGPLSPGIGPLGMTGPVGSGLMSLSDAVEAAASMREREAARTRDMRRR